MSKKKHKQQSHKRTGHHSGSLPDFDDDDELELDLDSPPRDDDDDDLDDFDDEDPFEEDRFRSEFDRWRDGLGDRSSHGGHGRQRSAKKRPAHGSRGRDPFDFDFGDDDDQ